MPSEMERRLTTILCADVAGYSRLMNVDEEKTLARLKETRATFQHHIEEHGDRVISMTGDGLLGEFPSVVRAVECAVAVQNILNRESRSYPPEERMLYRIGINLGDIMVDKDDIFGDGVNVAARLEAMAPAGGICISGSVFEQVRNRLPREFQFLGRKEIKNIAEPVPVYSLLLAEAPAGAGESVPSSPANETSADTSASAEEDAAIRAFIRRQAAFYHRAMVYGGIILLLFLINLATSRDYWWFLWPAGAMIFILLLHGWRLFSRHDRSRAWQEKKISEMKARKARDNRG